MAAAQIKNYRQGEPCRCHCLAEACRPIAVSLILVYVSWNTIIYMEENNDTQTMRDLVALLFFFSVLGVSVLYRARGQRTC